MKSRFREFQRKVGQIAGLDYLCNPFRGRFKKITQWVTGDNMLAEQKLQSAHCTEVGCILIREYTTNRPEKGVFLSSGRQSSLCD